MTVSVSTGSKRSMASASRFATTTFIAQPILSARTKGNATTHSMTVSVSTGLKRSMANACLRTNTTALLVSPGHTTRKGGAARSRTLDVDRFIFVTDGTTIFHYAI